MSATMTGADVRGLRTLGDRFTAYAEELRTTTTLLAGRLATAPWRGGEADRFRQEWSARHQRALAQVAHALGDAARELGRNADEQERASAASGAPDAATAALLAAEIGAVLGALTPFGADDPATVRAWWDGLGEAEQQRLLREDPGLLANRDGLPGSVRDAANRALLPGRIEAALAAHRRHPGDAAVTEDLDGLLALRAVAAAHPDYRLLMVDDSGHPLRAAVADGDTDTASTLAVLVPGTGATVAGLGASLKRLGSIRRSVTSADPAASYAGIFWLGYDAPDSVVSEHRLLGGGLAVSASGLAGVAAHVLTSPADGSDDDALNTRFADEGAAPLAGFADGLRAGRGDDLRVVADAHSYGGVVAGLAAQRTDAFDALVTNGAPGVGTHDVGDLRLHDGLYVNEAQWLDQWGGHGVAGMGDVVPDVDRIDPQHRFGGDPSSIVGAHVLDDRAVDVIGPDGRTHHESAPHGHSAYFDVGTHSAADSAAVILGRLDQVDVR